MRFKLSIKVGRVEVNFSYTILWKSYIIHRLGWNYGTRKGNMGRCKTWNPFRRERIDECQKSAAECEFMVLIFTWKTNLFEQDYLKFSNLFIILVKNGLTEVKFIYLFITH